MALPEVKREIRFMYSYTPNGLVVYDGRDIKRDIEGHIKLVNQSSGKLSVADWRVSGGDTLCHKRRTLPTEPPESEYCEPTRITGDVMRSGEATWHRMSYDPRSAEIADSIAAFIASKRTATASPK